MSLRKNKLHGRTNVYDTDIINAGLPLYFNQDQPTTGGSLALSKCGRNPSQARILNDLDQANAEAVLSDPTKWIIED